MKTYTVEVEVTKIKSKKQATDLAEEFYNYMFNKYSIGFDGGTIPIDNVITRVVDDETGYIPHSNK